MHVRGTTHKIFNNLFSFIEGDALRFEDPNDDTMIFNNTFYDIGDDAIRIDNDGAMSGLTIFNNIFSDIVDNVITQDSNSFVNYGLIDYNCVYQIGSTNNGNFDGTWGAGNINANPLFISTTLGDPDYLKLQGTSPCIDRGENPSGVGLGYNLTDDHWGGPRPVDFLDSVFPDTPTDYDIGAHECPAPVLISLSASNVMPGMAITYVIKYSNLEDTPHSGVFITDPIPNNTSYAVGSMRSGPVNGAYTNAAPLTDMYGDVGDGGVNSAGYQITFAVSNGTAPVSGGTIGGLSTGLVYFQAFPEAYFPEGTTFTNIAYIAKADRHPAGNTEINTVMVKTQYGGHFTFIPDNGGGIRNTNNFFDVTLYNDGNVTTTFYLSMPFTTNIYGADWSKWGGGPRIVEANSTNQLTNVILPMGGSANFRIMITADSSVLTGDWVGFTLVATNAFAVLASSANYTGDDGMLYGGDMGKGLNGTNSAPYYGKIYQQGNQLVVLSIGLVDVHISKSVVSPTNLFTNPLPGEYVRYMIEYENSGVAPATGTRIIDFIPAGTTYSQGSLYLEGFGPLTDTAGVDVGYCDGSQIIFCVNDGIAPDTPGTLGPMSGGRLYFTVMVNTNGIFPIENVVYITNKDTGFDGTVTASGVVDTNATLISGDVGASPITFIRITNANPDQDGRANVLGGASSSGNTIGVGDRKVSNEYDIINGLFGVSLGSIPADATIVGATFNFFVTNNNETPSLVDPFAVSLVDFGTIVDASDYDSPALDVFDDFASFGWTSAPKWYSIPCGDAVKYAFANPKWSLDGSDRWFQIKIRPMNPNEDQDNDQILIVSADNSAADRHPYLTVYYKTNIPGANDEVRALTGFDLNVIPDFATIIDADIYLNAYHVEGDNADIDPIEVRHVDYGNTIEGSDYNVLPLSSIASFPPYSGGWLQFDSTPQVQYAYTNAKTWIKNSSDKWFQIQIRPGQTSPDAYPDQQWINSADQGTNYPYIRVKYSTNAFVPAPGDIYNLVCLEGKNILTVCTNVETHVFRPPDFEINKIKSITLGGVSNSAMPGSTVLYSIEFFNIGDFPALSGIIRDDLPVGLNYVPGSLIITNSGGGTTNWTYEWSTSANPDQSYNSGDYSTTEPGSGIRWVRGKKDSIPGSGPESEFMSFNVIVGQKAVGTIIPNLSIITHNNFPKRYSANEIIVATQYGGSFNFITDAMGVTGTNYFLCSISNAGNITTTFPLSIPFTQTSYGADWSKWDIKIVGASDTTEVSSATLPMGGVLNFRVMIAVSNTVTNNAWIDFRLLSDTGIITTNIYTGDDGVQYGGDMGLDYTGAVTVPGRIYQQGNTNIQLLIANEPDIRIYKVKVSPVGNPSMGEPIRYRIDYTNDGGPASGVKITDLIPFGTAYVPGSMWVGAANLSDAAGDDEAYYDGSQVTFCVNGGTAPGIGGTLANDQVSDISLDVAVAGANYDFGERPMEGETSATGQTATIVPTVITTPLIHSHTIRGLMMNLKLAIPPSRSPKTTNRSSINVERIAASVVGWSEFPYSRFSGVSVPIGFPPFVTSSGAAITRRLRSV